MAGPALSPDTLAIVGTVVGTGLALFFGLGTMAWRMTSRLDRRIDADKAAADADRRAFQAAMDDFRKEMQRSRDDFRAEMQRLAERQSHVEGRVRPAE